MSIATCICSSRSSMGLPSKPFKSWHVCLSWISTLMNFYTKLFGHDSATFKKCSSMTRLLINSLMKFTLIFIALVLCVVLSVVHNSMTLLSSINMLTGFVACICMNCSIVMRWNTILITSSRAHSSAWLEDKALRVTVMCKESLNRIMIAFQVHLTSNINRLYSVGNSLFKHVHQIKSLTNL